MKIYQIGYIEKNAFVRGCYVGNMHTTRFVKADNEKEAIKIASEKLNVPQKEIEVMFEVKCIN